MKKLIMMSVAVLLVVAVHGFSEEEKADDQEMMKKWMAYATPGKMHKSMKYFAGKWDAATKYWMKPGDKAMEAKGTKAVAKMIMGGRYLKTHTKGKMMGQEFTGLSLLGYDNFNKKYVGIWIDSNGTGLFPYEGALDSSGKVRTDTGTWDDIMSGGKHDVRMVTTIVDDNTYQFEMFMKYPNMPEYKSMEMVYTRQPCKDKKKKARK